MQILKNKKQKEIHIIFDVGSASVGGAVVELSKKKNEPPKILHSLRVPMVFQGDLNFKRFTSSMLLSLNNVAENLVKKIEKSPDKISCFLSSPWYTSQTRFIEVKRKTPFVITQSVLDKLIIKETNVFKKNEIEKHPELKKNKIKIIENYNTSVKLNGYETNEPINKKAHKLEIAFYISLSAEKVLNMIEEKIEHIFNVKKLNFYSFTPPFFSAVRDIFDNQHRFLTVDISGEITNLSIIKNDILFESISFPLGRNFLIRRLVSGLKTTPEEAISVLNLYLQDKSAESFNKKIKVILELAKNEWLELFQQTIYALSKHSSISGKIYLVSSDDSYRWFLSIIQEEEFSQYTLSQSHFEVVYLSPEKFHDFYNFNVRMNKDIFLILEAIFSNKIYHHE